MLFSYRFLIYIHHSTYLIFVQIFILKSFHLFPFPLCIFPIPYYNSKKFALPSRALTTFTTYTIKN